MGEGFVPAIGRSIAGHEKYLQTMNAKRQLGQLACDLCEAIERQDNQGTYPKIGDDVIVMENQFFALIENDFPYSAYDGQKIEAHHMLVPRHHIDHDSLEQDLEMRHLLADAKAEAMNLADNRYSLSMTRTSSSVASSIKDHAHMHLLVAGSPIVEQHYSIQKRRNDIKFSDGSAL